MEVVAERGEGELGGAGGVEDGVVGTVDLRGWRGVLVFLRVFRGRDIERERERERRGRNMERRGVGWQERTLYQLKL